MKTRCALALLSLSLVAGCAFDEEISPLLPPLPPPGTIPETLAGWGLFRGNGATQEPALGVIPYEVIAPLFSDYSIKHRFIRLPAGKKMTYSDTSKWGVSDGTILVKTFAFPRDTRASGKGERLIETRLLVREAGLWSVLVYKWNDEQTEARRFVAGTRLPISWIDEMGQTHEQTYRIPSTEDCKTCHGGKEEVEPLGLRTRQLDRTFDHGEGPENQIDYLARLGSFEQAPPRAGERPRLSDPMGDDPLAARARSYLEGNCAHCHRQGGDSQSSGLWLNLENEAREHLGICKIPLAAGRGAGNLDFDIVPGEPDQSIMVFRMESTEPDIKMPEMPSLEPDRSGAQLIREWIAAMSTKGCNTN
jgi:uncharacterized repeat protein (TIGR03806 family)